MGGRDRETNRDMGTKGGYVFGLVGDGVRFEVEFGLSLRLERGRNRDRDMARVEDR